VEVRTSFDLRPTSRSKVHSTVHTPRHSVQQAHDQHYHIDHQSPPRLHLPRHLDHYMMIHMLKWTHVHRAMTWTTRLCCCVTNHVSSVLKDGYGSLESGDLLPHIELTTTSDDNNDDTFGGRISHGDNLLSSIALVLNRLPFGARVVHPESIIHPIYVYIRQNTD
jgi:hypothetical protein